MEFSRLFGVFLEVISAGRLLHLTVTNKLAAVSCKAQPDLWLALSTHSDITTQQVLDRKESEVPSI